MVVTPSWRKGNIPRVLFISKMHKDTYHRIQEKMDVRWMQAFFMQNPSDFFSLLFFMRGLGDMMSIDVWQVWQYAPSFCTYDICYIFYECFSTSGSFTDKKETHTFSSIYLLPLNILEPALSFSFESWQNLSEFSLRCFLIKAISFKSYLANPYGT